MPRQVAHEISFAVEHALPETITRVKKNTHYPKWLPVSPGTIAIDLQTVYNKGARTQDFWRTSKSLFYDRWPTALRVGWKNHWLTTEEVSFFHAL